MLDKCIVTNEQLFHIYIHVAVILMKTYIFSSYRYVKDTIILTASVQCLAALLSNYFWLLWLLVSYCNFTESFVLYDH